MYAPATASSALREAGTRSSRASDISNLRTSVRASEGQEGEQVEDSQYPHPAARRRVRAIGRGSIATLPAWPLVRAGNHNFMR